MRAKIFIIRLLNRTSNRFFLNHSKSLIAGANVINSMLIILYLCKRCLLWFPCSIERANKWIIAPDSYKLFTIYRLYIRRQIWMYIINDRLREIFNTVNLGKLKKDLLTKINISNNVLHPIFSIGFFVRNKLFSKEPENCSILYLMKKILWTL